MPSYLPDPAPDAPTGRLARLGAFCGRHAVGVIACWIVLLVAALAGRAIVGPTFNDQITLSGSQSAKGSDLLSASDPAAAAPSGLVVFHTGSGAVADHQSAIGTTLGNLAKMPHATGASPLVTSSDGRTAYTTVTFDEQLKALGNDYTDQLDTATAPARADGLGVAYGGGFDQITTTPANDLASELVGVGVALIILLLVFGSLLAAVLPLVCALIAVGVGIGVVGIVAGVITFATAAPTLSTMIGLGVGIDYALFLTTRFRQDLMDGHSVERAIARTTAVTGHAVLVAATTVSVAMLSLYACGLTFIGKLGLAATIAVVIAATASLTLVPAALCLVGRHIDKAHVRRPVAETAGDSDAWHRYAIFVSRHPAVFLTAGTTLLVVLAVPLFSMRLGHVDSGVNKSGTTSRTAFDWISDAPGPGFGPGANDPLTVVVDVQHATVPVSQVSTDVTEALQDTGDIARFTPVQPTPDGKLLVSTVTPVGVPQSASTGGVINRLTGSTLPDALQGTGATSYVTGTTASQYDFRNTVKDRLPIIIGIVLVAAFLLLMTVFRSLVIPVKAVLLNLLTTGASYGVLVAAFQWGWATGVLGLPSSVPIESYVPMMMFAIVFGLSMDYEIFLISRIAEAWYDTGDNTRSVGAGLSATGRVISSAALIMTAVFLSFVASPTVVIKMLAVGLAVSVILDATVVRLILVPSTMFLMGRANWWFPRRLDRILPRVHM
ncbi:MMPL family transporter [Actinacidiphila acidipaludis]|uniref:MMPL family transporter n=1 Tax=Actinacidiphila acidipaludis TaxID=2873382 RepID=A0ABS7Q798_9ACTN|nr:MMPL family transporter [Streptomyces acidipaludis]MBY8879012.1 MMPL family transporter [Streptomyces acidipaludis]